MGAAEITGGAATALAALVARREAPADEVVAAHRARIAEARARGRGRDARRDRGGPARGRGRDPARRDEPPAVGRQDRDRRPDRYHLIRYPVFPSPARHHGAMNVPGQIEPTSFTTPASLTGSPAATVRCGTWPEGPPIGVPLVARPWRDEVALAAALHLESELGGFRAPTALVAPGAASPSAPPGRP
jgi:Asp-tRNA(Asn)/Glu-tRNA(Gln) amidotransferase A subunit family amidase